MSGYKNVAVLGAGTMGHALALVHALGGCSIKLYDTSPEALERARGLIDGALATLAEAGEVTQPTANDALARITFCENIDEAVGGADLIIEAVIEDAEAKESLYNKIAPLCPAHAVLASNTSFLDIFPLMPTALQNRAMIVHWYTPPYIIDLVDIVPGPECEPQETERMTAFLTSLGKHPIVLKQFMPGYIANRIQTAINQEVFKLLDEGIATPEDIDGSITHGLALRLALFGQLRKIDYTGLDISQKVFAARASEPVTPITHCETLDKLVAEGSIGVSAGKGFYDYEGQSEDELFKQRDLDLLALRRAVADQKAK